MSLVAPIAYAAAILRLSCPHPVEFVSEIS